MDSAVLTLFAALPIASLVLFLSDEDKKWSVLFILGLIVIVMYGFYAIIIIPDLGNGILKWAYISLTALLPAVIYMLYIIAYDSKKPEPLKVLLLAVLIGIIAAYSVTAIGMPLFMGGFESELNKDIIDSLSIGFLQIAIPAELSKWLLLLAFLYFNKYYDEYLDGIVYSVCLSMGFAGVLGVWFMSGFVGFSTSMFLFKGVTTSLILIPIHLMSGASMGYFLAISNRKRKVVNTASALIVPILIDGSICSMLAMMGGDWWYYPIITILLFVLSIVLYRQTKHLMSLDSAQIEREKNSYGSKV